MNPTSVGVKSASARRGSTPHRIGVPFAAIPLDVKARRDVSPAAKLVFVTVANQARMRRGDVSNLTNRQISIRAGLSVAAVRRGLDQLEALGLVRRIFGESKRTRLGVAIAYQGCAPVASPPPAEVAHQPHRGCSTPPSPGCAPGAADLRRTPEEHPKTGSSPLDGKQAAAYLKACVAAGKRGDPMPDPPVFAHVRNEPPRGGCSTPPTSPKDRMIHNAPATTPVASPGAFLPSVGRMVASLADKLRSEDVGPRRVGPAKLARQLGEMRRKHGRRE